MGRTMSIVRRYVQAALWPMCFASAALAESLDDFADFNVPSQSLQAALIAFSRQADVQVICRACSTVLKSIEINGRLRSSDALERLLQGSGLSYRRVNEAVVVSEGADAAPVKPTNEIDPPIANVVDAMSLLTSPPMSSPLVTGTHLLLGEVRLVPQSLESVSATETIWRKDGTVAFDCAMERRAFHASPTTILLSGHQLVPAGGALSFADLSGVALAMKRVETSRPTASVLSGAGVAGAVDFVMEEGYRGAETSVRVGSVTEGSLQTVALSQSMGTDWNSGYVTLLYGYDRRDSLPASQRQSTADSDLRRFGGDDFSAPEAHPGTLMVDAVPYRIPDRRSGTNLTLDSLVPGANLQNLNAGRDVFAEREKHSVLASLSQTLMDSVTVSGLAAYFTDTQVSHDSAAPIRMILPASNPFGPTPPSADGEARYEVYYSMENDLGLRLLRADTESFMTSASINIGLSDGWEVDVSVAYLDQQHLERHRNEFDSDALNAALADSNPATAFDPFGAGGFGNPMTTARVRSSTSFSSGINEKSARVVANGTPFALQGGGVEVTGGAEVRDEYFRSRNRAASGGRLELSYESERSVGSTFAELLLPVLDASLDSPRWYGRLDIAMAGRYEGYSDAESAFSTRIGIKWLPGEEQALSFYGSWGKSSRPPTLADLDGRGSRTFIALVPDPQSSSGRSAVLAAAGGNADLKPQTDTVWRAGVRWLPESLNLALELSYFHDRFRDRIQEPVLADVLLTNPPRYAALVNREPAPAQREEICGRGMFLGNFASTQGNCLTAPVAAVIDARRNNTSVSTMRGLDFAGAMQMESYFGEFELSANVAYLLDFRETQLPMAASASLLDRVDRSLRFRMRDEVSWRFEGLGVSAVVNYAGSYVDDASVPSRRIGSWTTLDLNLSVEFDWGRLEGCSLQLKVQNLLDTAPPFVNDRSGFGYDRRNASVLNRFVSLSLVKAW